MSAEQLSHGGAHAHVEDPAKNGLIAVWLGLVALTFFMAVSVGANAYLRNWSPTKFRLPAGLATELPYWDTLVLIIAGLGLLITGSLFRRGAWKGFNGMMAVCNVLFLGFAVMDFWLMRAFIQSSAQVRTAYLGTSAIQFALAFISVVLMLMAGAYSTYRSKDKVRTFFPIAMNVWLYTVVSSIVILLVTNVMTVQGFGAWCGTKLLGQ